MPCQCDKKIRLFWVDLRLDAIVNQVESESPIDFICVEIRFKVSTTLIYDMIKYLSFFFIKKYLINNCTLKFLCLDKN